jgi:ADP-ribosylation factor-like protein 2
MDTDLLFWDLSGKETFRKMWENYLDDIEGLVYMIDSSKENIEESIKVLSIYKTNLLLDKVLERKELINANIPILILLNKIDLISVDEKKLNNLIDTIDYNRLNKKHFLVKEISAVKGTGLRESIRWLYNTMTDYSKDLQTENKELSYNNIV